MTQRPGDPPSSAEGIFEEEDDMFARRESVKTGPERRQRPRAVSEFVRRAIENTVGSVQSTGSISKDALQYLIQQGDRGRREIVRIVATEVGEFMRTVDISSEVVKILTGVQIELNATLRFKANEKKKDKDRPEKSEDEAPRVRPEFQSSVNFSVAPSSEGPGSEELPSEDPPPERPS